VSFIAKNREEGSALLCEIVTGEFPENIGENVAPCSLQRPGVC